MNFLLDKESEVVIYGAGPMAVSWGKRALCGGFKVRLFIDKNANNIKCIQNIPVVTFEVYRDISDKNDIVIVMLQNVMWHREIVENLWKLGVKRVIFFPMQVLGLGKEQVFDLRAKYNECIKFEFEDSLRIPILNPVAAFDGAEGIIWEGKHELTVWAPVELCYSIRCDAEEKVWKSDYTKAAIELSIKYIYDKSLFTLRPYWDLFSFLNGGTDECAIYLKIFGKEGHINSQSYDDARLLMDRSKLVEIYKEEICKGNEFFEQAPADSGVGDRGKIVIYDGIHRSIFLISNGYWWIPVRMSKEDYSYLFNVEAVQKLRNYIEIKSIGKLKYPVESLAFYDYPVKNQYVRTIWKEIARELTNREWKIEALIDFSMTDAYFSRMFYREGVKEIYCLLDNESEMSLLINDIFRIDNIDYILNKNDIYKVINECELIIIQCEQLLYEFSHNTLGCAVGLRYIIVFDVLLDEAIPLLRRIFGNNRRYNLIRRYVVDGIMKGMYIIE